MLGHKRYISSSDGPSTGLTPRAAVAAIGAAGVSCMLSPNQFGPWLIIDGIESAVALTLHDGFVTGAEFRFAREDDQSVVQAVANVFQSAGFRVADDEHEL